MPRCCIGKVNARSGCLHLYIHCMYIRIYTYICATVYVCVCGKRREPTSEKHYALFMSRFAASPLPSLLYIYVHATVNHARAHHFAEEDDNDDDDEKKKKKKKERTIATSIHDNDDDSQRGLLLPVSLLSSLRCRERKSSNRNRARTRTQPLLRACAHVSRGRSFVWRTRDVYMYVCICMCVCM